MRARGQQRGDQAKGATGGRGRRGEERRERLAVCWPSCGANEREHMCIGTCVGYTGIHRASQSQGRSLLRRERATN